MLDGRTLRWTRNGVTKRVTINSAPLNLTPDALRDWARHEARHYHWTPRRRTQHPLAWLWSLLASWCVPSWAVRLPRTPSPWSSQ